MFLFALSVPSVLFSLSPQGLSSSVCRLVLHPSSLWAPHLRTLPSPLSSASLTLVLPAAFSCALEGVFFPSSFQARVGVCLCVSARVCVPAVRGSGGLPSAILCGSVCVSSLKIALGSSSCLSSFFVLQRSVLGSLPAPLCVFPSGGVQLMCCLPFPSPLGRISSLISIFHSSFPLRE